MPNRHTESRVVPLITCIFVLWATVVYQNATAAAQGPATQAAAAPRVDQAQIDKGRQAIGQVCAACHANIARMLQVQKKTTEQWRDTVYSMIGRGAHVMPDEIEPLTQYLAANAGRPAAPAPAPAAGAAQSGAAPEPTGPASSAAASAGRAILEANCQACHDLGTATRKPVDTEWTAVIQRMVTYGARLTAADQQTLSQYLGTLSSASPSR